MSLNLKRFFATIIDFYVICFASSLIILIITFGTMEVTALTISIYLISVLVLTIFKDALFKDASLGKKIFKLKVVYINKSENKILSNIKRTLTLVLVPIEIVLIIKSNRRLGDMWAKTEVVKN